MIFDEVDDRVAGRVVHLHPVHDLTRDVRADERMANLVVGDDLSLLFAEDPVLFLFSHKNLASIVNAVNKCLMNK